MCAGSSDESDFILIVTHVFVVTGVFLVRESKMWMCENSLLLPFVRRPMLLYVVYTSMYVFSFFNDAVENPLRSPTPWGFKNQ